MADQERRLRIQNFLAVQTPRAKDAPAAPQQPSDREVTFVTPQTLATFPVASAVVIAVWGVLKKVAGVFDGNWVALVIALLVGAALFILNEETSTKQLSPGDRVVRAVVTIVNSFLLAAAALGIDSV